MRTLILTVLLLLVLAASALAQGGDRSPMGIEIRETSRIDTIIVTGNRVTKRFVVLSEMELNVGDAAGSDDLDKDQRRLESLNLFSRAQLALVRLPNGEDALHVHVTELWYIWPSVYLAVDDNNPSRVGYGAMISDDNFRGRRESISAHIRFGYIRGQGFDWNIPYLKRDDPSWSMSIHARSTIEFEPRYLRDWHNVESLQRELKLSVGKRFSLMNSTWIEPIVRQSRFRATDGHPLDLTASDSPQGDINGTLMAGFVRDTRHYKPWASNGYIFAAHFGGTAGLNGTQIAFLQPGFSYSQFFTPVKRIHLAGHVDQEWTVGRSLRYRRLLIDRDNGIRTSMHGSLEGTWRTVGSLEFRTDLLPITYITLKTFKPLQRYSRDLKFGISSALFLDGGVVGGAEDMESAFSTGGSGGWEYAYGVGLIFHVPYRDIIRCELSRSGRHPEAGWLLRVRIGTFF